MAQAQGGLVTSFLDTMQGLTQMSRQKEIDRQNAIQTATENAFRQHSLDIEQMREKRMEEEARARGAQTEERLGLMQQNIMRLQDQASWNRARDQARLEIARMAQQQRAGMSVENGRLKVMEFLERQGYDPTDPHFQAVVDGVTAEFWASTGMTAPKQPLDGLQFGPNGLTLGQGMASLGASPMAQARIQELKTSADVKKETAIDMHGLRAAQTTHTIAETKHLETQDALSKENMKLKWQEFGLNKDKFNFDKLYKNRTLDIKEFEASIHAVNAKLAANRFDLSAQKERNGLIKFATEYRERSFKARTQAGLAFDKAKAAVDAAGRVIEEINKLPKDQQAAHASEMITAQGVISGTGTKLKDLGANFQAAQKQYEQANETLYNAKKSGAEQVTPSGGLVPESPFKLGQIKPTLVKQLKESEARNAQRVAQSRQPRQVRARNEEGYVRVKTPAEAAKLKKGTQYVTPDGRHMVR